MCLMEHSADIAWIFPLFKSTTACTSPSPLGMEDKTILDSQLSSAGNRITSLSSQRIKLDATKARLNGPYAWSIRYSAWLQIDFQTQVTITGILTQGSGHRSDQWVTKLKIRRTIGTGTTLYYITGADNTEVRLKKNCMSQSCRARLFFGAHLIQQNSSFWFFFFFFFCFLLAYFFPIFFLWTCLIKYRWKYITDTIKHFEQQTSSTLCVVLYLVHPKIKFHISYWTKLWPTQIWNVCCSEKTNKQTNKKTLKKKKKKKKKRI